MVLIEPLRRHGHWLFAIVPSFEASRLKIGQAAGCPNFTGRPMIGAAKTSTRADHVFEIKHPQNRAAGSARQERPSDSGGMPGDDCRPAPA
jgi:hypothetical protein